jgi:hypothetical protein
MVLSDSDRSPDIIERIETFLSTSSPEAEHGNGKKVLEINQVLINEYQADQGISVSISDITP